MKLRKTLAPLAIVAASATVPQQATAFAVFDIGNYRGIYKTMRSTYDQANDLYKKYLEFRRQARVITQSLEAIRTPTDLLEFLDGDIDQAMRRAATSITTMEEAILNGTAVIGPNVARINEEIIAIKEEYHLENLTDLANHPDENIRRIARVSSSAIAAKASATAAFEEAEVFTERLEILMDRLQNTTNLQEAQVLASRIRAEEYFIRTKVQQLLSTYVSLMATEQAAQQQQIARYTAFTQLN